MLVLEFMERNVETHKLQKVARAVADLAPVLWSGLPPRRISCANRKRRRIETASGKFEHGLNLLSCHMKLLDDFLHARSGLKIFKNRGHGQSGAAKYPRTAPSIRHAFDGSTFGPIEACHVLTPLDLTFCEGNYPLTSR
jgi:hypothetical protein